MSEKKVVSRRVVVALGITCIVLLVLLIGSVYKQTDIIA
jgi:heme exporter protein D